MTATYQSGFYNDLKRARDLLQNCIQQNDCWLTTGCLTKIGYKLGNYPLTTLITPARLMVYQDRDSKGGFK